MSDTDNDQQPGAAAGGSQGQPKAESEAIWADLARHARSETFGDYPKRYSAIQDYAFRHYVLLLNAKQLRELAGGGSQTTAQAAIVEFRAALHRKVKFRLDMGDDVPEAFAAAASDLVTQFWSGARAEASAQFEEDRRAHLGELAELRGRMDQLQLDLQAEKDGRRQAEQAAAAALEQLNAANDQVLALAQERKALQDRTTDLVSAIDGLRAEAAANDERHLAQVRELQDRATQLTLEYREHLNTARREREATEGRLLRERDVAVHAREKALEERVDADLARARAEQASADAAVRLAQLEQAQAAVQSELASSVDRAGRAEAGLAAALVDIEQLRAAAQAQAFDHDSLLNWLDKGAQRKFAELGKIEALVARAILDAMPRIDGAKKK
jgi:hypothetical protein